MYPEGFRYSKDHEWLAVDGDVATLGITDFAQSELGDVVFLELPAVGAKLDAHEVLGTVESVKAVSDIYCPVAGEVTEVNTALIEDPEKLNEDPHGAAWLIKIRLADASELDALMSASDYQSYIQEQGH